jgi:hypothetical protein
VRKADWLPSPPTSRRPRRPRAGVAASWRLSGGLPRSNRPNATAVHSGVLQAAHHQRRGGRLRGAGRAVGGDLGGGATQSSRRPRRRKPGGCDRASRAQQKEAPTRARAGSCGCHVRRPDSGDGWSPNISMRPSGLEPPPRLHRTRPSTLRVYQFRHGRRGASIPGRLAQPLSRPQERWPEKLATCIRPRPTVDYEHMFVEAHRPTDRGGIQAWI